MPTIHWRPAVAGAVFAVLSYYVLVLGLVVPLSEVLAVADPGVVTVVVVGLQLGLLVGAGAIAASVVRRAHGVEQRRALVPTGLAVGLLGWCVVSVLTVAATTATGAPLPWGALALTLVLWAGAPLAGLTLVAPGPAERRSNRYLARLDRERLAASGDDGEVAAEYAGAIVLVVMLVGALLLSFGPGGAVSGRITYAICQALTFGQGGCAAPGTAGEDPHKPDEACVVSNSADSREVAVSVLFVAAKGGGTIRVEEMSDGTYRVSMEGLVAGGVTAGVGAGGTIVIDDHTYGIEASASASAYVAGTGGTTFVVDGEDARDDLVDYLKEERNRATLTSMAGPAGGVVSGGLAVWDWATGDDYQPPAPSEYYGQLGLQGDATAAGSGVIVSGSAGAKGALAIGSRVNVDTGAVTTYYTQQVSAEGALAYDDVVDKAELGASGSVEMLIAVTVDPEGNPVEVSVQGQAVGEAKAQVTHLWGAAQGPSPSGGQLYAASVELTGPETLSIATDLLRATGVVPYDSALDQATHAYDALGTFVAAARDRGIVTRQDLTTDSSTPFAIQAGGQVGPVGLGGSFKNSSTEVESTGAQYLSDGRWKDWIECA